jgi:hypothetical protein
MPMQARTVFVSVSLFASLAAAPASFAADWPEVKLSAKSAVTQCATPGRLMAMAKARNPNLDKRFELIAADYKRHGEALGIRWDYVFFQMLQETGDLSFKTGGRAVKADQNNFAGLGAAKDGETGERFADVSTGVRAHLEHVMIYAGLPVENPVAERTRKVQQWKVIKPVEGRAATFGDVVERWAPKSRPYADAITNAAKQFDAEFCKKADPQPERIAVAPQKTEPTRTPVAKVEAKPEPKAETPVKAAEAAPKVSGADLAKKAIDDSRSDPSATRSSLGAGLAKAGPPAVKILNDPAAPAEQKPEPPEQKPQATNTALPPPAAQKSAPQRSAAALKCRVWTASYGGDKALIIRSAKEDTINFTVLDVNAGQEKREADAYIAAYAPGGKIEAEFANQTQALDKAFDLCPEG